MPLKSKRSRVARQKRDGRTAFAKCAISPSSPDHLDYSAPESDPDAASTTEPEPESTDESEAGDRLITPVEELQHLFSVFLPLHLRLKEKPSKTWQKHQKMQNRPPVYTGESRTTAWRKNTTRRKAAQGCTTLDAFMRVCSYLKTQFIILYLIVIRSGRVALHQPRKAR